MQRVGAYEVLYELSSGGMGSVLLGRRRGPGSFEKLVAIKTIRAELAAAPQVRAMFLDEAAILARLGHPAVATVHDFGEEGKTLYLVMEYVAGVSLHAMAELAPPPHIVAAILAEACRGIHAAHELTDLHGHHLDIVHRDISPDNVLLGFDGHVKVIDFGIALIKGRQAPVTELGMLKGKPPYMSPEQIKNEPIDRRSDVFALGAVLWEMLVGEPLFSGDSIYAIARAVEHQEIPRPSSRVPDLLPGLDSIALEALQRDLSLRTPTAAAMAARLDEVVAAAEGETLAEWTQRCLAAEREDHRRWLAEILQGSEVAPRRGRATGEVTALAASPASADPARAATAVAAVAPSAAPQAAAQAEPLVEAAAQAEVAPPALSGGTSAGVAGAGALGGFALVDGEAGLDAPVAPPRRDRFFAVFAVLFLALAGLIAWIVVSRTAGSAAPAPADADVIALQRDAAVLELAAASDAAPAAIPDAGAALAPDAAAVVAAVAPDAGRGSDAGGASKRRGRPAVPPPDPDATLERDPDRLGDRAVEPVQLPGKIHAFAEPYANVFVDGKPAGPTPVFDYTVPAGRHVVTFVDPVSGDTRARKTVDVPANDTVKITAPPQKP